MLANHQLICTNIARPALRRLIATTHADLFDPKLRSYPKLSGSGPFALDPEFNLLGSPYPSTLHVKLPSSGALYVNSDHAAVTGISLSTDQNQPGHQQLQHHTKAVQSTFGYIVNNSDKRDLPFLYKKLVIPDQPATVLVSSVKPSSCLTTIAPSKKYDWIVFKRSAILAWSGSNIELQSEAPPAAAAAAINSAVRVSGSTGSLTLSSCANSVIYEYKLQASEHVYLKPSSVLALTVPATSTSATESLETTAATPANDNFQIRHIYSLKDLQLPAVFERMLNLPTMLLPSASTVDSIELLKDLRGYWTGFKAYTSSLFSKYFWQDDRLVKVAGPAIVLVDTRHPSMISEKIQSFFDRV
ncbi:hypothetical protein D0Z03_002974 [Geotrichum reessii]|nr:hypothetical protein D0Z03_002974 [Galactomyces reessii]